MILNVSGRTDIVAFYCEWFMKRYQIGFLDVRNPFYGKQVSRIYFDDVEAILFCTKNPIPIIKHLKNIKQPIIFQVTLTPYKKDIEPHVPDKTQVIEAIKEISAIIGKENLFIRYDPIFINQNYSVDYHIKAFDRMCTLLKGYVQQIIIGFIDEYKNVRNNANILQLEEIQETQYEQIAVAFSEIAHHNNMTIQTCNEKNTFAEHGFIQRDCVPQELAYQLTGRNNHKKWTARNTPYCNCVAMVDVGVYNSCSHFCKYCYANYDETLVKETMRDHLPDSSLLVGKLNDDDTIKKRKK